MHLRDKGPAMPFSVGGKEPNELTQAERVHHNEAGRGQREAESAEAAQEWRTRGPIARKKGIRVGLRVWSSTRIGRRE